MPSPRFESKPNATAISVTNHYTGLAADYTRAFGDGPRHFEPWSRTTPELTPPPSPSYHTIPMGGRLSF
ncbi:hypothetical protein TNCV_5088601 [Trichonephila clavipes]|nr:hypothetical protein TNCV_5088601 [Trichonephila clavipes]